MSRPVARLGSPYSCSPRKTEPLPFTVRLATNLLDIERIAAQRGVAYSRHQPDLVRKLRLDHPEADDLRPDVLHLMAENGRGQLVGSMRLNTNINQPLRFEREFNLPAIFQKRSLLEAGRMTSARGPDGQSVVPALIKFAFEISYRAGVDHLLLIARSPIDRIYKALTFEDVFPGQKVETSAQPGVQVSLFHIPIASVDQRLREAEAPFYQFLALTEHTGIDIDYHQVHARFNTPIRASLAPAASPSLTEGLLQSPCREIPG